MGPFHRHMICIHFRHSFYNLKFICMAGISQKRDQTHCQWNIFCLLKISLLKAVRKSRFWSKIMSDHPMSGLLLCSEVSSKALLLNRSELHKLIHRGMKAQERFFQCINIVHWCRPHFCCNGKGKTVCFCSNCQIFLDKSKSHPIQEELWLFVLVVCRPKCSFQPKWTWIFLKKNKLKCSIDYWAWRYEGLILWNLK